VLRISRFKMGLETDIRPLLPPDRLLMVVGNYGSGKTEFSVNLAISLAAEGLRVSIADLDIVNPYFRCREAGLLMKEAGVRVVVPPGDRAMADLPIIMPEIKGMLRPTDGEVSLFDVGGDPVGARLLSSFSSHMGGIRYAMWQVINSRRPFTDTVDGCIRMMREIEESSRLRVTGFIANSHLVTETTGGVVLEGCGLVREVSERTGVPPVFCAVMDGIADEAALSAAGVPLFRMQRRMLPPWLRPAECVESETQGAVPAGRSVPLGRRGV
jgi:hypothetical protein